MTRLARSRSLLSAAALIAGALLLAGCETTGSGPAPAATAQTDTKQAESKPAEPPMTHSRAAELCWMSTEKSAPGMNLDKRADLVDKCIADKMKASPKS